MAKYKLLIKCASQVVTIRNDGDVLVIRGNQMQHVDVIEAVNDDGVSVLVGWDGRIAYIGHDSVRGGMCSEDEVEEVIDASGKSVIPGFVDAHTHPVWAGDRVHEFAMKLAGATYMEVHKAGGGIHYTVEHTRLATQDELYVGLSTRLFDMLSSGTTCVECKSGYGLNTETEIKMLKVIEIAKRELPITISSTFCGAHAVPKDKSADEAARDVIDNQLPAVAHLMAEDKLHVDNIDVFCEKGVFDVDQSRAILQAGKEAGLQINFHGDELNPLDGAKGPLLEHCAPNNIAFHICSLRTRVFLRLCEEVCQFTCGRSMEYQKSPNEFFQTFIDSTVLQMGAELNALAISHLEEISDTGITAMSRAGSIGVVLPTTAYILRLKPPPVRKMLDSGMAVALGSDFNPNAYCMSMPTVMHLACVLLKMSMSESLIAATLNSAAALGLSKDHGSLSKGKYADCVIIDAPRWEHIIYQFGCHDKLIEYVIRHGDIVHSKYQNCG